MSSECKIYVGDLPRDAEERELERAFGSFGKVRSVWIARNPPGFGFVEMEDRRDVDDAVKQLDGAVLCGVRVRVEISNGRSRPKNFNGRRGFGANDRNDFGVRGNYGKPTDRRRGRYRSRSRSPSGGGAERRNKRRSPSYNDRRSPSRSRSPPPRRVRSNSGSSGGYSR